MAPYLHNGLGHEDNKPIALPLAPMNQQQVWMHGEDRQFTIYSLPLLIFSLFVATPSQKQKSPGLLPGLPSVEIVCLRRGLRYRLFRRIAR